MSTSKLKAKAPKETPPGKMKGMMFGKTGVGKSWLALDFPRPYYYDVEDGAILSHYQDKLEKAGGDYMGTKDGTLSFETLIDQVKALATEKHDYGTLVIDSITKLYQSSLAEESEKIESKGNKDEFGASKKQVLKPMRRLLNWISKLDMNVWFIAHEVAEYGINPATKQREQTGVIADVWDKLPHELELVLNAVKRGPQRLAIVTKSRLLGFPEGESFDLNYAEFAARYGKDYIERAPEPVIMADPDQIAEINRLLGIVKIDEDTMKKWMTKAKAESFEEFNFNQAQKVIDHLRKTIQ